MKQILAVSLFICGFGGVIAGAQSGNKNELYYSKKIAEELGGEAEFRTPDGSRVDILTDTTAYEVEWVYNWESAIGQSIFYGMTTNKDPGVILLLKGDPLERADYLRCLAVCGKLGIRLETRKIQ